MTTPRHDRRPGHDPVIAPRRPVPPSRAVGGSAPQTPRGRGGSVAGRVPRVPPSRSAPPRPATPPRGPLRPVRSPADAGRAPLRPPGSAPGCSASGSAARAAPGPTRPSAPLRVRSGAPLLRPRRPARSWPAVPRPRPASASRATHARARSPRRLAGDHPSPTRRRGAEAWAPSSAGIHAQPVPTRTPGGISPPSPSAGASGVRVGRSRRGRSTNRPGRLTAQRRRKDQPARTTGGTARPGFSPPELPPAPIDAVEPTPDTPEPPDDELAPAPPEIAGTPTDPVESRHDPIGANRPATRGRSHARRCSTSLIVDCRPRPQGTPPLHTFRPALPVRFQPLGINTPRPALAQRTQLHLAELFLRLVPQLRRPLHRRLVRSKVRTNSTEHTINTTHSTIRPTLSPHSARPTTRHDRPPSERTAAPFSPVQHARDATRVPPNRRRPGPTQPAQSSRSPPNSLDESPRRTTISA